MTIVNQLINKLGRVLQLHESTKSAEKARVAALKNEAGRLFKECYSDFNNSQTVVNASALSSTTQHGELHIMLAEGAFYTENYSTCRLIVERFLQMAAQQNQFYCRAKVLLGLLIDHEATVAGLTGDNSLRARKEAVAEIMAAFNVASKSENVARYKFLIFNISVAFWRVVNPFLRATRANSFAADIGRIVDALEAQQDGDKEWRIMYLSAAALCAEDGGGGGPSQAAAACAYIDKGIALCEQLLSVTSGKEAEVKKQLEVSTKELEETMLAFRAIEEREILLSKPRKIDPDEDEEQAAVANAQYMQQLANLEPLQGLAAEGYDVVKERMNGSQGRKAAADAQMKDITDRKNSETAVMYRLFRQRIQANQPDAKRFATLPNVTKDVRSTVLVQLQTIRSGIVLDKEVEAVLRAAFKQLSDSPHSSSRSETLLDVARCALSMSVQDQQPSNLASSGCGTAWNAVGTECYELARTATTNVVPVLRVKMDVCDALITLQQSSDVSQSVNKATGQRLSALQLEGYRSNRRIECVKALERAALLALQRVDDKALVQEICVIIWNCCLPLVQTHLILKIYTAIKCVTNILEEISSPLVHLRNQAHYIVAQCEERTDFVSMAATEGVKAMKQDYGSLDPNYSPEYVENAVPPELDRTRPSDSVMEPFVNLLALRCNVFDAPSDVDGKVALWLQQARESTSKQVITDMVTKSLYLLLEDEATGGASVQAAAAAQEEERRAAAEAAALEAGATAPNNGGGGGGSPAPPLAEASSGDFSLSLMMMQKGQLDIPPVSVEELSVVINKDRTAAVQGGYTVFTRKQQGRVLMMSSIVEMAAKLRSHLLLQPAAVFVLGSAVWDSTDPLMIASGLIDSQINSYYLLADSFVGRMQELKLPSGTSQLGNTLVLGGGGGGGGVGVSSTTMMLGGGTTSAAAAAAAGQHSGGNEGTNASGMSISAAYGARSFGLKAETEAGAVLPPAVTTLIEDMQSLKKLALESLTAGIALAMSVKDIVAVQNGLIYFWNLHIHIVRQKLYTQAMDEVLDFLQMAVKVLEELRSFQSPDPSTIFVDEKLCISYYEALSEFLEARGDLQGALEAAVKGGSGACTEPGKATEYQRKALCEAASKLQARMEAAAAAGAGGGGGDKKKAPADKGKKGGGDAGDGAFKLDNPLLVVFAALAHAELPSPSVVSAETLKEKLDKAVLHMNTEVKEYLKGLNWVDMTVERFGQMIEMQCEAYGRICRLQVLVGDIIAAQAAAEACLQIVSTDKLSKADINLLGNRVWRWVSVCERLLGQAITTIIQPGGGQDVALQCELRLAALLHYALACEYARKAEQQQLIVDAATGAWNAGLAMVHPSFAHLRPRLYALQRRILNTMMFKSSSSSSAPKGPVAERINSQLAVLRQQFFLAVIEGYSHVQDWAKCLAAVMEAFNCVPAALQKPLWTWRVIAMSKQGKSVLDGLQKLKEGDVSLQAQVYAILARNSSNPKQQLDAYLKALDILSGHLERVDYMLETSAWMASAGLPREDVSAMVTAALDALYEVEERGMQEELEQLQQQQQQNMFTIGNGGGGAAAVGGAMSTIDNGGDSTADLGEDEFGSFAANSRRGGGGGGGGGVVVTAGSRSGVLTAATDKSSAVTRRTSGTGLNNTAAAAAAGGGASARSGRRRSSSSANKRGGSTSSVASRGTAVTAAGAAAAVEEDSLPSRLNMKQLDQAVSALCMQMLLECDQEQRTARALEAVYFIQKSLSCWSNALYELYRADTFGDALSAAQSKAAAAKATWQQLQAQDAAAAAHASALLAEAEAAAADAAAAAGGGGGKAAKAPAAKAKGKDKGAADAPVAPDAETMAAAKTALAAANLAVDSLTFDSHYPECPSAFLMPTDAITLLSYRPPEEFNAGTYRCAMTTAESSASSANPNVNPQAALDVPTARSFPSISLSLHYITTLSEALCEAGYAKHGLLCLTWGKMVLSYVGRVDKAAAAAAAARASAAGGEDKETSGGGVTAAATAAKDAPLPSTATVKGREAWLVAAHYRTVNILYSVGLSEEAEALSPLLLVQPTATAADGGAGGTTVVDYVSTYIRKAALDSDNDPITPEPTEVQQLELQRFVVEERAAAGGGGGGGGTEDGSLSAPNAFGFYTHTDLVRPDAIEEGVCMLDAAYSLYSAGQFALSECLTRVVRKQFTAQHIELQKKQKKQQQQQQQSSSGSGSGSAEVACTSKLLLQCASILASVATASGRHQEAYSLVISHRPLLHAAGDCTLVAAHTCSMLQALCGSTGSEAQLSTAKELAVAVMDVLFATSSFGVDKAAVREAAAAAQLQGQQTATASATLVKYGAATAATLRKSGVGCATAGTGTVAKRGTVGPVTAAATAAASGGQYERSYEHAQALAAVTMAYISLVMYTARQKIAEAAAGSAAASSARGAVLDLRPCLDLVNSAVDRALVAVYATMGESSRVAAALLQKRAAACGALLHWIHTCASSGAGQGVEAYSEWMLSNVQQLCCVPAQKALDLRRALHSKVPFEDMSYSTDDMVAAAAAAAAPPTADNAHEHEQQPVVRPYKELSALYKREFGECSIEVAVMLLRVAMLKGEHLSAKAFGQPPALDAIAKYMVETRPADKMDIVDFTVPLLQQARQLSSASEVLLAGTDLQRYAQLLFDVISLLKLNQAGTFDGAWDVASPSSSSSSDAGSGGGAGAGAGGDHAGDAISVGTAGITDEGKQLRKRVSASAKKALTALRYTDTSSAAAGGNAGGSTSCVDPCYVSCSLAAYALLECYGRFDSGEAACWLMMLQSMQARDWLQGVWVAGQVSNSPLLAAHCRLASLNSGYTAVHSNYALRHGGGACVSTSNALGSTVAPLSSSSSSRSEGGEEGKVVPLLPAAQAEQAFLSARCTAFRRLSINNISSPAEAVSNAPQGTAFLCLQCDPLKQALYVSVGMKGASAAASSAAAAGAAAAAPPAKGGKGGKGAAAAAPVAAAAEEESNDGPLNSKDWLIDKMKLDESTRRALLTLTAQHTVWKADVAKFVSTYGEVTSPEFDLLTPSSSSSNNSENKTMRKMERALDERLRALIEDMDAALAPILGPESRCAAFIKDILFPSSSTSSGTSTSGAPVHNLILLLDTSLQSLPFEGLDCFAPCQGKLCREFSVHLFQHRLTALSSSSSSAVSAANMKYLVDPLQEDEGCAVEGMQRQPLRTVFQQSAAAASASSAKWTKVKGGEGNVAVQDFISAVDASGTGAKTAVPAGAPLGLLSCTLGRFSSLLSPADVCSLNLEKVAFFGCFDMCLNDVSSRRQISADVQKSQKELLSEQSINSAALLSLCGVGCMVSHSWSTPLCAQNRFLGKFLQEFTGTNKNNVLTSVSRTYRVVPSSSSSSSSSGAGGDDGASVGSAKSKGTSATTSSNSSSAAAAAAERELQVKKWVRLSRVVVGLPTVTYTE